jgi:hypothetical protein
MNRPWTTGPETLRERIAAPEATAPGDPASALPPYLESFLAHLRLLVGVPFEYLVPDPRLLPEESIRFFHVDRSWSDRLVDGAISVGKIGTREQAHHQAIAPVVASRLDLTERAVRTLQRGALSFEQAKAAADADATPAGPVTGFLLRSAAVSGWPDLEVRAFRKIGGVSTPLRTLRLERLQETVMIALFDGVPDAVWCEEPHHGVAFGIPVSGPGASTLATRDATGLPVPGAPSTSVPFRAGNRRVVAIAELRKRLHARHAADPARVPEQSGAAAFAVAVLAPPWRQRFEGTGAHPFGGLVPVVAIAAKAADPGVRSALEEVSR